MAVVSLAPSRAKAARSKRPATPRRRAARPPFEVQPKLKIGKGTDACETEADEMASFVLSMGRDTGPGRALTPQTPGTAPRQGASPTDRPRPPAPDESTARAHPISPVTAPSAQPVQRPSSAGLQEDEVRPKRAAHPESQPGPHEAISTQGNHPTESFETEFEALRRAGGQPLPRAARDFFEPRFGADFSNVRAYTGPAANRLAESIGARAFTYGTDIVFADGQLSTSPGGLSLLAHELTHILQQRPSRQTGSAEVTHDDTLIVRRACACGPQDRTTRFEDFPICCGIRGRQTIRFDALKMPTYKSKNSPYAECKAEYRRSEYATLIRSANYTREDKVAELSPEQVSVWTSLKEDPRVSRPSGLQTKALDLRAKAYGLRASERAERLKRGFFFENPVDHTTLGAPTLAGAMTDLVFPKWSRGPNPEAKSFQVDHMVELQVANWTPSRQHGAVLRNLWLLEQSRNGSAGTNIKNEMKRRVEDHVAASANKDTPLRDADYFLERYAMHFDGHTTGLDVIDPTDADVWQKSEIVQGDHLEKVEASDRSRFDGREFEIRLYRTQNITSTPNDFAWHYSPGSPSTVAPPADDQTWAPVLGNELRIQSITLKVGPDARGQTELGHIEVNIPSDHTDWKSWDKNRQITILRNEPDALYAGHVKQDGQLSLQTTKNARSHKKLSPTEVTSFEFSDGGYRLDGRINAEAPLFHDAGAGAGTPLHINFTEVADESSRASSDQLTIPDQRLNTSSLSLPEGLSPTRVDMGIREGRGGHVEIYGGVQASVAHLGELDAKASLGARGIALAGNFHGTGVFQGLNAEAHYTQYSDDTRSSPGGLSIVGTYTIPVGTVPYLEAGEVRLAINNDSVSFDGSLSVQETAWLEPGSQVHFSFAKGAIQVGGSARLRGSLLPPGITVAELGFKGAFVENGLDLQARASATFDLEDMGMPIKSLQPIPVEAIWKNGEITIGGTISITGDLGDTALSAAAATGAPAAGPASSFRLENATLSLYVTSRRLSGTPTESEVVPTLGEPMERGIAPAAVRAPENTELVWWGGGGVDLKYGDNVGADLRIDVSPDKVWTLSGTVRFGTLTTLMGEQQLLDLPREEIELGSLTLANIPIAGPVGVGVKVGANVYYYADIKVGPVTVDQAVLIVSGTLGVPDSLEITGQAGLSLRASGGAGVGMAAKAGVNLTLIGLSLAGVDGSIEGSLEGSADASAAVNVIASWSPRTGLCLSDIGPDFGLDLRLEGSLKAVVDIHVAWFSILRKETTLASFTVNGPKLGDIFGSERLSRFRQSGQGAPCLGQSMDATEFGTGIRDRFQNKKDMTDYVTSITRFLGGGPDSALKPELDQRIDPDKLPESQARAQRLATAVASDRVRNLAGRYGLRPGGTLAFDVFGEFDTFDGTVGQPRGGMLLGMEQDGDLVVADLAVELLGLEFDTSVPIPLVVLLKGRRMSVRVLGISEFYDRYGERSAFTGRPAWYVGQVRLMNQDPLDDSPPRPFAPADCPNCHDLTQRRRLQPQFLFDTPATPIEDSPPLSGQQTCTTCHRPSVPQTLTPWSGRPRLDTRINYAADLTEAQHRALLQYIEASK
jgi:hypothetical protein